MKVECKGVVVELSEEECFTLIKALDFFDKMVSDCLEHEDVHELQEKYGDRHTGHVCDLLKKTAELRDKLWDSGEFY